MRNFGPTRFTVHSHDRR